MLKLVHANKRLKVIIFKKGGKQVIIKTFKKEKCRVAAIKTNTNKAV